MSFIVVNSQNEPIEFEKLTFNQDDSFFQLEGSGNTINIKYEPKIVDSSFENKQMACYFFQNAYLNAENNVFQVYYEKKRIGWIFPIQALVSNENDFADNIYLAKYKFSTYNEILKKEFATKKININPQDSYSLIDLFDEDIIIFCVSLETIDGNKIEISDFLPSFANYGYYLYDKDNVVSFKDNERSIYLAKYTGEEKLKIKQSIVKLNEHSFLQNIYLNYLKSINDKVLRFFMLYQVIEYFLDKEFNFKFDEILNSYQENKIDKNTFREKMNKSSSERTLIKQLTIFINDENMSIDFIRDGKLFLESFGEYEKNEVGDIIYDIRNLLIHRYRDIDALDYEKTRLFQILTNQLEQIINNFMINYSR